MASSRDGHTSLDVSPVPSPTLSTYTPATTLTDLIYSDKQPATTPSRPPFFGGSPFVIIAGGSGFVGSHVIHRLLTLKYKVLALQRKSLPTLPADSEYKDNLFSLINCDLAARFDFEQYIGLQRLRGCFAIINCVGIKQDKGDNTMDAAHVEVTKQLLGLSQALNVKHFIHISVACVRRSPESEYHDSKYRAELLIKGSTAPYTILRPTVIFGRGDDCVSNLVQSIKLCDVFPLPGLGTAKHTPVHVLDVAECIVTCLQNEKSLRQIYEVAGPDELTVRDMVRIVSQGLRLPVVTVPTPVLITHYAATAMCRFMPNPIITPAQVKMLSEGMCGDSKRIQIDLDAPFLCQRHLTAELVGLLEPEIPSIAPVSLRIAPSTEHYSRLEKYRASSASVAWVVPLMALLACLLSQMTGSLSFGLVLWNMLALVLLWQFGPSWTFFGSLLRGISWKRCVVTGTSAALVAILPLFILGADTSHIRHASTAWQIVSPLEEAFWRGYVLLPCSARFPKNVIVPIVAQCALYALCMSALSQAFLSLRVQAMFLVVAGISSIITLRSEKLA